MLKVRGTLLLLLVSLLTVTSTRSRDKLSLQQRKRHPAESTHVEPSADSSSILETLDEQDLEDIENFRRRQEEKQRLAAEDAYSEEVEELQMLQRYGLLPAELAGEEGGPVEETSEEAASHELIAEEGIRDEEDSDSEDSVSREDPPTSSDPGYQNSETSAERSPVDKSSKRHQHRFKGFFGQVWKGIKKGARVVGRVVGNLLSLRIPDSVIVPPLFHFRKQDVEDCVACQYVWYLVELEVGNDQIYDNIFNSFTQACLEAQKAAIFYPACQRMLAHITDIITDYTSGDYNINQLCLAAGFCRDPYPPTVRQV